jgi:hypothetical protein
MADAAQSAPPAPVSQAPEQVAARILEFLATHPAAALLESGKLLFDFRLAHYSVNAEHGRCMAHFWSEERNLIRQIVSFTERKGVLRLSVLRMGQARPQTLELVPNRERRQPSERDATRTKYLALLQRVLERQFPEYKVAALRTAMDLERSFGPAYARGLQVRGTGAWAVIAVNAEESPAIIHGILTLGILWLHHCREHPPQRSGVRVVEGLRIVVPAGMGAVTAARLAWLNAKAARWELYELDERSEDMWQREADSAGNLQVDWLHAPDAALARERFSAAIETVQQMLPAPQRAQMEIAVRGGGEVAFLWHGLEFARARTALAANSFSRSIEITFGAGAHTTQLTDANAEDLRALLRQLASRRHAGGDKRDTLYRMQPERWLESRLRATLDALDLQLDPQPVYAQVPAFSGAEHSLLDLLAVRRDGRLAVVELKASEDLHLALQALDYWMRVRQHCTPGAAGAESELQRRGYFPGKILQPVPPLLYLAAPALRIHPATETVLRYFSPQVEWTLAALDERWREQVRTVYRKRSNGQPR